MIHVYKSMNADALDGLFDAGLLLAICLVNTNLCFFDRTDEIHSSFQLNKLLTKIISLLFSKCKK